MEALMDDIVGLEMTIRGSVIFPSNEPAYQAQLGRLFNPDFAKRKPLMFIVCHDAGDIQSAVKFCVSHNLPLRILSGGHSACGASVQDGAVTIDVSRMINMTYDPTTECLTMGPGCNLSDVNIFLLRYGRMTPVGVAPPTGVGGLVLHGGIGHLSHKFGTSVDNVTELEIVLADGSIKTVNKNSTGDDKDLFFAARGAAGTIGIVTSITMHTYPTEMITGGCWIMPDDENYTESKRLVKKARDLVLEQEANGERKFTGVVYLGNIPHDEAVPEAMRGANCTVVFAGVWGADEEAMTMISEFCTGPVLQGKPPAPMPFNIFNQCLCGLFLNFKKFPYYWSGVCSHEAPDENLDAYLDLWTGHDPGFVFASVGLDCFGGKAGVEFGRKLNEGNEHCVSSLRDFTFSIPAIIHFLPDDKELFDKGKAMSKALSATVESLSTTKYSNFYTEVQPEDQANFNKLVLTNEARLTEAKKKFDPDGVFTGTVINTTK